MTPSELKETALKLLSETENKDMIALVYCILKEKNEAGKFYVLNAEEIASIDEAEAELKRGKFYTQNQITDS